MSIDKTIRIEQLPVLEITEPDNLFVVNDANNVTKSIRFDKLLGNITELPSLSLPPAGPGAPNLTWCEEGVECLTGIGAGDCEIYITACGDNIVTINQGGVTIDGSLEIKDDFTINGNNNIKGDLNVEGNATIDGDFTVGKDCNTKFVIDSKSEFKCDTEFVQNVQIGKAGVSCDYDSYLNVSGPAAFNCSVTVFGEADVKDNFTVDKDTRLKENVIIGTDCSKNNFFIVNNRTEFKCDVSFEQTVDFAGGVTFDEIIVGKDDGTCDGNFEVHTIAKSTCGVEVGPLGAPTIELKPDGEIVAEKYIGDGSALTNLNISGNLIFLGEADFTESKASQGITYEFTNGNFAINTGIGDIHPDWAGPDVNNRVEPGNFMYFTTAVSINGWYIGFNNIEAGFMTVSTAQTISGEKTYDQPQIFKSEIGMTKQTEVRIDELEFIGNLP